MAFGDSSVYRSLSDADVARWMTEWSDNGLLSWDIWQYVGLLVLVAVPFVVLYYLWILLIVSSRYRAFVRSGVNGVPVISFAVGMLFITTIMNDIFFAVLFTGPVWAAVYQAAGADAAIGFEQAVAPLRASAILFGAWG